MNALNRLLPSSYFHWERHLKHFDCARVGRIALFPERHCRCCHYSCSICKLRSVSTPLRGWFDTWPIGFTQESGSFQRWNSYRILVEFTLDTGQASLKIKTEIKFRKLSLIYIWGWICHQPQLGVPVANHSSPTGFGFKQFTCTKTLASLRSLCEDRS